MRIAALVLAAGAASRFGSPKLLAQLDGRAVLQHVLDAVAAFGPPVTLVVLGHAADEVEAAMTWRGEHRVRNPDPDRGLASSLRTGLDGLASTDPAFELEAALILLGDQPRVRPEVMHVLVHVAEREPRPIVVPRYALGGGSNPVLLRRDAWLLAARVDGDTGLGPMIASRPELVLHVPVEGDNPDVDTPADLEALAGGGSGTGRGATPSGA